MNQIKILIQLLLQLQLVYIYITSCNLYQLYFTGHYAWDLFDSTRLEVKLAM